MRTAITLARNHGSTEFRVIAGPEPINKTILSLKDLRKVGAHPRFAEIHAWSSDGGKFLSFRLAETPKARPARAAVQPETSKSE